jgi:hypothetical protein
MTNPTLSLDENVLKRARIRAMLQGTTINALVRDDLTRLPGESEAAQGMADFLRTAAGAQAASGGRSWSRDDRYDA